MRNIWLSHTILILVLLSACHSRKSKSNYKLLREDNPSFSDDVSLGEFKEFMIQYNNEIDSNPHSAEAWFRRGDLKEGIEDHSGALLDYNKAIEINPSDSFAFLCRGNVKGKLNDFPGACMDWIQAMKLGESRSHQKIIRFCRKKN